MKGTALVTGASKGIGREISKLFAKNGYNLILVARSEELLNEFADDLRHQHGVKVYVESCDLTSKGAPSTLFNQTQSKGLAVTHLVNNAGFGSNGNFLDLDREREIQQIELNVKALTELTHLYLQPMKMAAFGRILNISSTAGFQPGPRMAVYFATKAYVSSFTEAIAFELKGLGITATAHCPGATNTHFGETASSGNNLLFKLGAASAESVAISAYKAMQKGKPLVIHGFKMKIAIFVCKFLPRWLVKSAAARLNRE